MSLWPRRVLTIFIGTPARSMTLAAECRAS